jgi:hypothetical protein
VYDGYPKGTTAKKQVLRRLSEFMVGIDANTYANNRAAAKQTLAAHKAATASSNKAAVAAAAASSASGETTTPADTGAQLQPLALPPPISTAIDRDALLARKPGGRDLHDQALEVTILDIAHLSGISLLAVLRSDRCIALFTDSEPFVLSGLVRTSSQQYCIAFDGVCKRLFTAGSDPGKSLNFDQLNISVSATLVLNCICKMLCSVSIALCRMLCSAACHVHAMFEQLRVSPRVNML